MKEYIARVWLPAVHRTGREMTIQAEGDEAAITHAAADMAGTKDNPTLLYEVLLQGERFVARLEGGVVVGRP